MADCQPSTCRQVSVQFPGQRESPRAGRFLEEGANGQGQGPPRVQGTSRVWGPPGGGRRDWWELEESCSEGNCLLHGVASDWPGKMET